MLKRTRRAAAMRGISLVELMVGIAVGLFIVAAAALLTSGQLSDNRRLLVETQLQQDLRASADIITRDMRRAGFTPNATTGVPALTSSTPTVAANSYDNLMLPTEADSAIRYAYRRDGGAESFGFRRTGSGAIQSCQSDYTLTGCSGGWQDLTDSNVMTVLSFDIAEVRSGGGSRVDNTKPQRLICPNLCTADPNVPEATACWPTVTVREFVMSITARSRADAAVVRTLKTSFKVRNLSVGIAASVPANQACPAPL